MKDFAGTPGTITSLVMRLSQMLLGIASLVVFNVVDNHVQFPFLSYMMTPIIFQIAWSFIVTIADAWAVWKKTLFHTRLFVFGSVVIDLITLLASLGAIAISSDILDIYIRHSRHKADVKMFQMYITLMFLGWILTVISSLIQLWILPATTTRSHSVVHHVVGPIPAAVGPTPRMTDIQGMPGTPGGLVLRLIPSVMAGVSLCVMAITRDFMDVLAFRYLMVSAIIQCIWSLCMAMVYIFAMIVRRRLVNSAIMTLFTVGDGVTSTLLYPASCGCAESYTLSSASFIFVR